MNVSNRLACLLLLLALADLSYAQHEGSSTTEASERREQHASLSAAYQAARYAATPVDGGHVARNPAQGWQAHFDRRGGSILPDAGGWSWGLELESFGFALEREAVSVPRRTASQGARIAYHWSEVLEEWYINRPQGLEHGFTLTERPERGMEAGDIPLTLILGVRGDLLPRLSADRRDVQFTDAHGKAVVDYAGLYVHDSRGREQAAWFELAEDSLVLHVDESSAIYPLTIDPTVQQAFLKAPNADTGDQFGMSLCASGNRVVIGAPNEDGASSGVNGNMSNNGKLDAGAAYVFVRNAGSWSLEAYLKASNSQQYDHFGESVSISGDTIVVGAWGEDSRAVGVNGVQTNNDKKESGAAYVFVLSGNTWSQQAYLKASNADVFDRFGNAVAVDGDTIVVGAFTEDSPAMGVGGDQGNAPIGQGRDFGAAYVFVRNGQTWSQEAYLKQGPGGSTLSVRFARFGEVVAVSGDTVAIGSPNYGRWMRGRVEVYQRSGSTWSYEAQLGPSWLGHSSRDDEFGKSLALQGDYLLIGAPGEDGNGNDWTGNPDSNGTKKSGAAYLYRHTNGPINPWTLDTYLKADNREVGDYFGSSVALSPDTILVGAEREKGSTTGVDAVGSVNGAPSSGAAYIFEPGQGHWVQDAYLKATHLNGNDRFGATAALGDGFAVVGATGEDSGPSSGPADNSKTESGAAYVFERTSNGPSGSPYCLGDGSGTPCPCTSGAWAGGCANSTSQGASLTGSGNALFAAETFALSVSGLPASQPGLCLKGSAQVGNLLGNPSGNGLLCTSPDLRSQVILSDAGGAVAMTDWRGQLFGAHPGAANEFGTTYYQWWYRDVADPCNAGFNFSNGWSVDWE